MGVWKKDKIKNKLQRLQRVVSEAARQSGRADQLTIIPPQNIDMLLTQFQDVSLKVFFDPQATSGWPLIEHQFNPTQENLSCVVLVGPEGGLSTAEIEQLKHHGWYAVKLNTPILRTETAGVIACALAIDRLGYLT